jgi:hypothetical protein
VAGSRSSIWSNVLMDVHRHPVATTVPDRHDSQAALPEFKHRLTDGSPATAGGLCRCYNQLLTTLIRNCVIAADAGAEAAPEDASESVQA